MRNCQSGIFRILYDERISNVDFYAVSDDAETGYFIECDLEYQMQDFRRANCVKWARPITRNKES